MVDWFLCMMFGDVHLCWWMSLLGNIFVVIARFFRPQSGTNFSPLLFLSLWIPCPPTIPSYFRFLHWGRLSGRLYNDVVFSQWQFEAVHKNIFIIFVCIVDGCVYFNDNKLFKYAWTRIWLSLFCHWLVSIMKWFGCFPCHGNSDAITVVVVLNTGVYDVLSSSSGYLAWSCPFAFNNSQNI